MPAAIPIISLIIGAASVGTTLAGDLGAFGGGFQQPKLPTGPQPLSAAQQQQTGALIGQQFPTLQSQVGGSVSPEYYLQMAQLLSGTSGAPGAAGIGQQALNNWFGLGGGTSDIGTNASAGGLGPLGNAFAWGGTPTGGTSTGLTGSTLTSGGGGLTGAGGNFVSQMIDQLLSQHGLGSPGAFA